jgi:hypothetical protein
MPQPQNPTTGRTLFGKKGGSKKQGRAAASPTNM